jgi:exosortase E/protease (VPEID-CTERM system)
MNDSPTAIAGSIRQMGLAARVALIGVLFLAEKVFLNIFVDFQQAQLASGLGAILRIAQHWGFRFVVAFAAAVALFAYVRGGQALKSADASIRSAPMRVSWILVHTLLVACLVPVSYLLYRTDASPLPFAAIVTLGLTLGLGAALSAALAFAPSRLWLLSARALGIIWCYAAIVALVSASAMQLSQRLWAPTAALTFDLVRGVLTPLLPGLAANVATKILSTEHFAVEISEICSGLEGVGLMLAFTLVWLVYFRREYIFPRALVLVPIGVALIFCLNILRIAALMLIGDHGFPDVAQYGFHSQAGWISFNVVACGLVFFSRRTRWLTRTVPEAVAQVRTYNPTAIYLMPLLAILATGALSHAMSGGFETFYPLRFFGGLCALAVYWKDLAKLDWGWSWRGPAVGLAVFLIWLFAAHFLLTKTSMPGALAAFPPTFRGMWIAVRLVTSVLLVPIAEELAYRGYLMRRLINADFESVPYQSVRWVALTLTAIVFGLAHGTMWFPGIIAGLSYGLLVMRRGTIGEAVAAHATTNLLVAAAVLAAGQWQLW